MYVQLFFEDKFMQVYCSVFNYHILLSSVNCLLCKQEAPYTVVQTSPIVDQVPFVLYFNGNKKNTK